MPTNNLDVNNHPKWTYISSFFSPTTTNAYGIGDIYLFDLMFMNYVQQLFDEILDRPEYILYGGKKEYEVQLMKIPALSIHQNTLEFGGENYPVGAAQLMYIPVKYRIKTNDRVVEETGGVRLLPFKAMYTVKLWVEHITQRNLFLRHIASRFTHIMVDRYYNKFIEFYNSMTDEWKPYSIYIKLSTFSHPLQFNVNGDNDNRWKIMQAVTFEVNFHAYEFQRPTLYLIEGVKYAVHEALQKNGENVYFVVDNDRQMTASELDHYIEQWLLTSDEEG